MGKGKNILIGTGLALTGMIGASIAAYETGYLQEVVYPDPLEVLPPETVLSELSPAEESYFCFQDLDPDKVCDAASALVSFYRTSNYVPVAYQDVNPAYHHMIIKSEDQRFIEKDDGIYEPELANAFLENRGGSGITEQVARNCYKNYAPEGNQTITIPGLGQREVPNRKVWEIFKMAPLLKKTYSNEEIIQKYDNCNTYFGCLSYGLGSATQTYFGVKPGELDYAKSATLAALIRSPSALDGYDSDGKGGEEENQAELDQLLIERNKNLEKLDEPITWFDGTKVSLTQAQIDAETVKPLGFSRCSPPSGGMHADYTVADSLGARHYVDKVLADMRLATGYSDEQLFQNTRVNTTLDLFTQSAIKQSVDDIIAQGLLPQGEARRLSVVVLRKDGSIAGYYVGDYEESQVDLLQSYTPYGSAGKDVILAEAKEEGMIDENTVFDDPPSFTWEGGNNGQDWTINGGNHCSEIGIEAPDYRCALARSSNPIFLQLAEDMGPGGLDELEAKFSALGAPSRPGQALGPSYVLGAIEKTPLGLATAKNSLYANNGSYVPNFSLESVYAFENGVDVKKYEYPAPEPVEVFSPDTAQFVLTAARGVVGEQYRGTARKNFQGFTGDFAGKTGSDADLEGATNVAVFGGTTSIDSSNQAQDFLFKTTINGEYTIFAVESHIDGLRPLGSGHNGGDLPALVTRKIADRLLDIPGVVPSPID